MKTWSNIEVLPPPKWKMCLTGVQHFLPDKKIASINCYTALPLKTWHPKRIYIIISHALHTQVVWNSLRADRQLCSLFLTFCSRVSFKQWPPLWASSISWALAWKRAFCLICPIVTSFLKKENRMISEERELSHF